jgi:NAD(P)-dependent dehydrogenase (short-subunit alcohol dehydrogenase family)
MSKLELRFDGEVAIVAGGGGSIGGATARLYAKRGAKVAVTDISDTAEQTAADIVKAGGEAFAIVGPTETVAQKVVDETIRRFGGIDVVFNTAGAATGGPFHPIAREEWNRVFDSHVAATLALSQAAWPHLVASGNGRLVNTSSTASFGSPWTSTYVAAKGAILSMSRAWAMEGVRQNVRVNAILPTAISQMTERIPDAALVKMFEENFKPGRVAGLVAFLSHRDTKLNGVALEVGGGRAAPVFLAEGPQVVVDAADTPEAWAGHAAALGERKPIYAPASMMDELQIRLNDYLKAIGEKPLKLIHSSWSPKEV